MSKQDEVVANGDKASPTKNTRKGVTPEDVRVYTSLAEARANRPQGKETWDLRQFTSPDSISRWTWAPYGERGLWQVCEADGWSMINLGDLPAVSDGAGMLAALSPEDRAALLEKYMPTPTTGKGKGK